MAQQSSSESLGRRDLLRATAIAGGAAVSTASTSAAPAVTPTGPVAVSTPHNAVVETASGKVRGYTEGGVFTFKGIPYAATTEGKSRFLRAAKPAPWAGIRNSLTYGPVCPPFNYGSGQSFQFERQFAQESEDCLRVNIWTPGINDNCKRPVLFWLHSMGFHSGSSHDFRVYDGANLARRGDVVVVSINHRINIFGFCNLTDHGDRYADSANVGLLDILDGLQWVRENIARFGGDSGNVTVFGQSGGGMKVCALLAMPGAQGLFHKSDRPKRTTSAVGNGGVIA